MSKLDHTSVNYTGTGAVKSVTLTNCVVGKPIFAVHRSNVKNIDYPVWCYIRCTSGSADARPTASGNSYHHYCIGTYHNGVSAQYGTNIAGGANCYTVIASAATVVFEISNFGSDSTVFFYQ